MYDWRVEFNTLTLNITGQEDKWILDRVKGTSPVPTTFNETTMIGVDGVTFNGSKRSKRNLVFTLFIEGDCEANREQLYEFFAPNNSIRLYCDTPLKNVYIDGVVETCECEPYEQTEVMQISVLCPDPQFKKVEASESFNMAQNNGIKFPLSVKHDEPIILGEFFFNNQVILYNNGKTDIGFEVTIEIFNNTNTVSLFNIDKPSEHLSFSGEFLVNDIIHINTNPRVRNRATITRNGVTSSLLNKLVSGSSWIKIDTNVKVIGCNENCYMAFITRDEVIGI